MKQIQKGVYLTPSKKLLYMTSPLKKAYPPNGLTIQRLVDDNPTRKDRILTIYRNLIRLTKYLQFHKFHKYSYTELVKLKIRQDYAYRRNIFFNDLDVLSEEELYQRLINTLNFIHNATLDTVYNETKRPVSMEYKILDSILQYEISKGLPSSLRNSNLKDSFFTLEKAIELRKIERSWNMIDLNDKKDKVWWIGKDGLYNSDVCFKHLVELRDLKSSNFSDNMVQSILHFEKSLILLNEESKLII